MNTTNIGPTHYQPTTNLWGGQGSLFAGSNPQIVQQQIFAQPQQQIFAQPQQQAGAVVFAQAVQPQVVMAAPSMINQQQGILAMNIQR